jgi:peptide/nickel transport system permease protein
MGKYILKRMFMVLITMFIIIFIIFTIMNFSPGDPGRLILGPTAPQINVDRLNEQLGIYDPFFTRFFNYVKGLFAGNLGTSYRTNKPVAGEIFARFPYTLNLAILSIVAGTLLGIALGIMSAIWQYSALDAIATSTAMILAAVPGFFLGMVLIYITSLKFGWFPSSGVLSWKSWVLPVLTNSLPTAANLLRLMRTTMLETIRQDYIRTVRAKGAGEFLVIINHALINALLPILTTLGMRFGTSLGGSVIIESIFGIPGLGKYIVDSIRAKDVPTVLSSVMLISAMFCLVMLAVDLLYAMIDPRIKAKYMK